MYSRFVFFRPAQRATSHLRRYATEATKGGSNAFLYGGLAVGATAAAGGGYYFLGRGAADAPPSKAEEQNVPQKTGNGVKPVKCFTGGEQGFVSLLLQSSDVINHNTKRLRFHLPEEESVSGLNVASALITKYKGPDMQKPVIRPYTPVSDEDAVGYLDLVIKKYPDGPMSTHLHDMAPGQRLDVKGPVPKYAWEANKHRHIALIAGGTGITPMYQLARTIFKNPTDDTKVTLVFGNVSEQDVLLKSEWDALENEFPNRFRAFYTLDNPPEGWRQGKGRITKDLLKTVLPPPEGDNVKVFVCGPPGLYKAISGAKKSPQDQGDLTGYLAELGYAKEQVYKF